jgi:Tol biopolymer transport system component
LTGRQSWEKVEVYDLVRGTGPQVIPFTVSAMSPDGSWVTHNHRTDDRTRTVPVLRLLTWPGARTWLEFSNADRSAPTFVTFSPDGRRLAFGSQSGTFTGVDLPALRQKLPGDLVPKP